MCFSSAASIKVECCFAHEWGCLCWVGQWLGKEWDGGLGSLLADGAGGPVSAKASELFSVEPAGTGTDLSWIAGSIGRCRSLPSLNLAAETTVLGFCRLPLQRYLLGLLAESSGPCYVSQFSVLGFLPFLLASIRSPGSTHRSATGAGTGATSSRIH